MNRRRYTGRRRRNRYADREDLNPMNFVSNLSDVMLILAVGIMLALVIHWNVKIKTTDDTDSNTKTEDTIEFDEDDLQGKDIAPEDMDKMGEVYYDPVSGKYYIVTNDNTQD